MKNEASLLFTESAEVEAQLESFRLQMEKLAEKNKQLEEENERLNELLVVLKR